MGYSKIRIAQKNDMGKQAETDLGNQELPTGKWSERSLREFISALPYTTGDRATMRAQVKAIRELLAGDKLTAKLAGDVVPGGAECGRFITR